MAITSEIIGKLGGAKLESYPVSVPEFEPDTLLRAVTVPAGKRYLVAASGHSPKMSPSNNYKPALYIGDVKSQPVVKSGSFSVMAIVESSVEVRFDTNSSSGSSNATFEGMVYVLEL